MKIISNGRDWREVKNYKFKYKIEYKYKKEYKYKIEYKYSCVDHLGWRAPTFPLSHHAHSHLHREDADI